MAGVKQKLVNITNTTYTTDPQLDSSGNRGPMSFAHMTAGGVRVEVSFDGKTPAGVMDPSTGIVSLNYEFPYYEKAWVRLLAPGAVDVQIICEGI